MSPAMFTLLISIVSIQDMDSVGLKGSQLVIERVTGPPPVKSLYLTEDSGVKARRVSRNAPPGLYVLLNITKTLPNATTIVVRLFERHNNAYKSELVEYKNNLCDYLAYEHRPILTTMKDVLKFPPACPVEPGVFKVDNWQISKMLPPMLPIAEGFKLQSTVNFKDHDNIVTNVFLKIGTSKQ